MAPSIAESMRYNLKLKLNLLDGSLKLYSFEFIIPTDIVKAST